MRRGSQHLRTTCRTLEHVDFDVIPSFRFRRRPNPRQSPVPRPWRPTSDPLQLLVACVFLHWWLGRWFVIVCSFSFEICAHWVEGTCSVRLEMDACRFRLLHMFDVIHYVSCTLIQCCCVHQLFLIANLLIWLCTDNGSIFDGACWQQLNTMRQGDNTGTLNCDRWRQWSRHPSTTLIMKLRQLS